MKHFLKSIIAGALIIAITGCKSSEKFVVKGTPGSTIYSPQRIELATIGNDGKAKIEMTSDAYYAYLLTHDKDRNLWIPFALDTKSKKRTGTKTTLYGGITLATVGTIALLPGTIMVCNSNEDTQKTGAFIDAGGAGVALLGLGLTAIGNRMSQVAYRYEFTYQDTQFTNQDINFTSYNPPIVEKSNENQSVVNSKRRKATGTTSAQSASSTAPQSKAKRSRQSSIKTIEGKYSGNGRLSQNNKKIEDIQDLTVNIIVIDNNTVKVEIYEGGDLFFETEEIYTLSSDKKGDVILVHSKEPSSTIRIKNNLLTYTHPKIGLDNEVFNLTIKATKK